MGSKFESGKLTIPLSGRIDSSNAASLQASLLEEIDAHDTKELTLELSQLSYISSAGLRLLMKIKKDRNIPVEVTEVTPEVYEILEVTGFTELFKARRKMREISVEGLPVIGKGFYGTVYRIDSDTIVKVYNTPDAMDMIENEKKKARLAFIKGVPTAISFDIVRVGDTYGSVFELINARTMMDVIREQPDKADEVIEKHAKLMKQVNETLVDPGVLPRAKDIFLNYLEIISSYLDESLLERLRTLIIQMPDDDHLVHGDMQYKNVMISGTEADEEPILIDMDTLCVGQPIFDLYGMYLTYKAFPEDDPDNNMVFSGITTEMADHIWDRFLRLYLGTDDEKILRANLDRIMILAYIRLLFLLATSDLKEGELGRIRLKHSIEHLTELSGRVDRLESI